MITRITNLASFDKKILRYFANIYQPTTSTKPWDIFCFVFNQMARLTGLEPATPGYEGLLTKTTTYRSVSGISLSLLPSAKCRLGVVVFENMCKLTLRPWGCSTTSRPLG